MSYSTVEEVRAYIGITGDTYDDFLSDAIDYCSGLADELSGRDWGDVLPGSGFNTHSVTEYLYLDESEYAVQLREWPVQSVQAVLIGGDTISASLYRLEGRTGKIRFLDTAGYPYPRGPQVQVNYVGGYEDVPWSLLMFVRRGVSYLFNRRDAEGLGADLVGETQTTFRPNELRQLYDETMGGLTVDLMR